MVSPPSRTYVGRGTADSGDGVDAAAPPGPQPTTHLLLLLADSALPIGSFAFSSGLESYLAHGRGRRDGSLAAFVPLSLSSLAAHRRPPALASLDDQLDAAVVCTVARRASVAQGRALLGVWERSLAPALADAPALRSFAALLRHGSASADGAPPPVAAHLAPLFGAVCARPPTSSC